MVGGAKQQRRLLLLILRNLSRAQRMQLLPLLLLPPRLFAVSLKLFLSTCCELY